MEILYKIFDLIGKLYSSNKADKKEKFKHFVEPLIADLNLVHKNYVETFLQYLETINTSDKALCSSHPIFETILTDSILSDDIRIRIFSFYDTNHLKEFETFAKCIFHYFASMYDTEMVYSSMFPVLDDETKDENMFRSKKMIMARQLGRYELAEGLESIFNNEADENKRKDKAKLKIYEMITILQNRYRKVIDEYNNLKTEYLT